MRRTPSPEQLRAYVNRPWGEIRRAKEAFWAQQARAQSAAERLSMSGALWEHGRRTDPEFLGETARRADLQHHVRLAERLHRVADVFARR